MAKKHTRVSAEAKSSAAEDLGKAIASVSVMRDRKDLYPRVKGGGASSLSKAFLDQIPGTSRQDSYLGWKPHPFNFQAAGIFKMFNVHHSACIEAKVACIVGLGFRREPIMETLPGKPAVTRDVELGVAPEPATPPTEAPKQDMLSGRPQLEARSKVAEVLDPLCPVSFQDIMTAAVEDRETTGNGYIEVIRGKNGKVAALFHCPARDVHVVVEEFGKYHYEVVPSDGSSLNKKFARFGDLKRMEAAYPAPAPARSRGRPSTGEAPPPPAMSELIHLRRSSSYSKYYGYPDWLAAVLSIELSQCSHQHLYDFFLNRGVPELLIVLRGGKAPPAEWDAFKENLRNHIGLKNSHKTMAVNLASETANMDVHKLAMEGKVDGLFSELADVLAMEIVSAHGVPPLLAGIQIPGKLGATNELANALKAFQSLRVGPAQFSIESTLQVTLGAEFPEIPAESWKLRTILEEINVDQVDTIGRMREPVGQAMAEGRDLGEGVKA